MMHATQFSIPTNRLDLSRKIKLGLTILCLFAVFPALAQQPVTMNWLEGTWKITTGQGQIVETWKILNDSTLTGESRFVKTTGESMLQETLEIARRKGEWTYTSTVQGQNDGQPVAFKVIFARGTEFIAENPDHDFPQRISYRRIDNRLFASIEGRKNGKFGKQNFDFIGD